MRPSTRWITTLLVAWGSTGHAHDIADLEATASRLYSDRAFDQCGEAYDVAAQHDPTNAVLHYNAACCRALNGETDAAFAALGRAIDGGYTNVESIEGDPDLVSLHTDPRWSALVERCRATQAVERTRWESPVWAGDFDPDPDETTRLAGLSKLWAETKWNFANFDLVPALDWDSLYVAMIPSVRAATDVVDYYRLLIRMGAMLHDGHTYVWRPSALADRLSARPGLTTRLVDGHVVILDVWDDALGDAGVAAGQEIVAIDGTSPHDYVTTEVAPFVSASTPQDLDAKAYGRWLLIGDSAVPIDLDLRDANGRTVTRRVRRLPAAAGRHEPARAPFEFEKRGDIGWVRLNTFNGNESADAFLAAFDELASSAALVLDVRDNGGGNSGVGYRVLATLVEAPFQTSAWSTREYRPAYRAWGRVEGRHRGGPGSIRPDAEHHFAGPVAVLIGPRTYSAAEDFTIAFDVMDRGLLIGESTAGSTGQPLGFALPGGGRAQVCTKRDTYPDGRAFVGVGIPPDIVVSPTLADVRSGQDPVLETALTRLREAIARPSP